MSFEPVLPGDDVRAVHAREDDGDRASRRSRPASARTRPRRAGRTAARCLPASRRGTRANATLRRRAGGRPSSRSTTPSRSGCGRTRAPRSASRRSAALRAARRARARLRTTGRRPTSRSSARRSTAGPATLARPARRRASTSPPGTTCSTRGFFAGFPRRPVRRRARRLLYPLDAGLDAAAGASSPGALPERSLLRLGRALESAAAGHAARGRAPRAARRALRGACAALGRAARPSPPVRCSAARTPTCCGTFCSPRGADAPAARALWQRRRAEGAAAVRRLIELVRAGRDAADLPGGPALARTAAVGPFQAGPFDARPAAAARRPLQPVGDRVRPADARARARDRVVRPARRAARRATSSEALGRARPLRCR